jgi:hypothetical protein
MSKKKNKQYDYDFEQELNHEIPKIRNLSEENVWNQPDWTGRIPKASASSTSNGISRCSIDDKIIKKQPTWEKPYWAVGNTTSDSSTTKSTPQFSASKTATNSCNITTSIVKDPIIKPNEHPILKTSALSQIDQEMESLQKQIDEAKRKKALIEQQLQRTT